MLFFLFIYFFLFFFLWKYNGERLNFFFFSFADDEGKITELGCTPDKNICENNEKCIICDKDECNSATSNTIFASMVFSLSVIIFFMK